jgi:cytochrome c peroxidase
VPFLLLIAAFSGTETSLFHQPEGWPLPAYPNPEKMCTPEKVILGRMLFYDPVLSADSTVSCASCHLQYTAFSHVDHKLSHGINDRVGSRNAPPLMNLAWQRSFMWDGAVNHLDVLALAPITHPDEMNEDFSHVLGKLQRRRSYRMRFMRAFGDSVITGELTLKSLSAFMLTLISHQTRYDSVRSGLAVYTSQEQRGHDLFRSHCASCHTEPLFCSDRYENNGLPADRRLLDKGRMSVTRSSSDSLRFKVPTLRNLEFSYPYMHDGRFQTLYQVLDHYAHGITPSPTLAKELRNPLAIGERDKVDLIAFLLSLTDRQFLFNKAHSFPRELLNDRQTTQLLQNHN